MSMTEIDIITAPEDSGSAVSWQAILAGAVTAAAITLILVAFGVGVGFSVISPWSGQGVSASTFTIGGGIFLVIVAMLSSTIGGYIAGRLRSRWQTVNTNERYFRDSAHGLVTWALSTLAIATVLGGAMSSIIGAGAGAGLAVAGSQPADAYIDSLLRTNPATDRVSAPAPSAGDTQQATAPAAQSQVTPTLSGGQLPTNTSMAPVNRGSIARILGPAMIKNGTIADADRTYLTQLVAARTGLPEAQARQRVDQTINDAKAAADKARKSTAAFAFWLAFALLAGALSASLAAIEGGSLRNRDWWVDSQGRTHAAPAK